MNITRFALIAFILALSSLRALSWDQEGHRLINLLALRSLPPEFPSFVRGKDAEARLAYLSSEPDRWRSSPDYTFRHVNEPDHFFDLDYLDGFGLTPKTLPPFRYDFIAHLALQRAKNPSIEPVASPERDPAHYRAHIGFLPWAINEQYSKLKASFSILKTFEQHGGTEDEIRNARENIIHLMGEMGHHVGDATQPLHTTKHFNGWVGPNPDGFATNRTFHAWIDGGFLSKVPPHRKALMAGIAAAREIPGANAGGHGIFGPLIEFLEVQHGLVRPLYQLDKDGKLNPASPASTEGRAFLERQLLTAGQMLGNIWLTAWRTAPEDNFLKSQLAQRALKTGGK